MTIKIDLEKAYDRINWDFLLDALKEIGLNDKIIDIIQNCVSTSSLHVLCNGFTTDSFTPLRGLHQRDPLSPYLFVLYIETLAHYIQFAVNHKAWKPIDLTKSGPKISHLFFADDILIFIETCLDQVQVVKTCLEIFCDASSQKVNAAKTKVFFFSRNVNHVQARELSQKLGFSLTSDLGKYLGVLLLHKRRLAIF